MIDKKKINVNEDTLGQCFSIFTAVPITHKTFIHLKNHDEIY